MKKIVLIICMAVILFTAPVQAAPVTLIDQGDTWNYAVMTTDLWSNWASAGYSSFNWNSATWLTGQAAFGNPYSLPYHTYWAENTDLALTKQINVNGIFTGSLTLNVASDNGFIVFINGIQIAKDNAEGYTNYWVYTINVDPSVFSQGLNTVSVLTEDHGVATFFDMKLTGNLQQVPEPATMLLLILGLVGLGGIRRKIKN